MRRNLLAMAAGAALVAALGAGAAWWLTRPGTDVAAQCGAGEVAADIGGPFELVSETGATVTDADVITKPALIYFGYTFCPDVCPLDTVRNAEAVDILAEAGHDVLPVFISIDPERDTPEALDAFTANVHPAMLGLTGSPEQVQAASRAYRTYYRANREEGDDDYYLVDHSTFSYLVLPETGFAAVLRRELTGAQVAEQISCILDAQ